MQRVKTLAESGVCRLSEIRRQLKVFVGELFEGQELPAASNSRYWPKNKSLLNAVYRCRAKTRSVHFLILSV